MVPSRPMKPAAVLAGWIITAVALALPAPLHAQDDASVSSASGFALGRPRVFLGGHLGLFAPRADSDLYDMITRELTLDKSDFRAAAVGGDFGIPFASHFAAVVSLGYSRSTSRSESRDFIESNGDPITQTTRLSQVPLTVTLRYYPRKLGETVGSFAWIPTRLNPYLGAGAGILHYDFSQYGRFVDRNTLDIFDADLKSSGLTDTEHVAAGMDISLTPRVFVNGEARYSWAGADLSGDFTGFQPIDLGGFRLLGGVYFRF